VEYIDQTGSTNADLLESAPHRLDRSVLVTDHQTAGRGRLDRRWDAPPGANLLVSVLFHEVPAEAGELVRRLSLAAVDAVRLTVPGAGTVGLKWPNDILLEDGKLAGVLAQRSAEGAVVVGIGVNVGWCPRDGAKLGDGIDRPSVLAALLTAYDALPRSPDDLMVRYRDELSTLGQRVRVQMPSGDVVGDAADVTQSGQLRVRDDDGKTHQIAAADVIHLRPA